jgi:SAM-dependent methyltransferase
MAIGKDYTCIRVTRCVKRSTGLLLVNWEMRKFDADNALAGLQDEKDRMDIYHKFFLVARREQLHSTPFTPNYDGPRILDLGCGTGIWAIDMAEYGTLCLIQAYSRASTDDGIIASILMPKSWVWTFHSFNLISG